MTMTKEEAQLLGEIKGKLDMVITSQKETNVKLGALDNRLRRVETRSALNGAISGGLVSIGIALAIEKGKSIIGLS